MESNSVVQFPIVQKKGKFVRKIPRIPEGFRVQFCYRTILAVAPDYPPMVLLQDATWRQLDDLSRGDVRLWDYGR